MKRSIALTGLLALLAGCQTSSISKEDDYVQIAQRPPRPLDKRPSVAVIDFVDKSGYGQESQGGAGADILMSFFSDSGQMTLVERQQIKHALDELKLQHSGVVDPMQAQAVGKMTGARYVVYGSIVNFGSRKEKSGIALLGSSETLIFEASVSLRMIEVETANIIASTLGNGSATKGATKTIVGGSTSSFDQTLGGKCLQAAIARCVDKLLDRVE